MYVKNTCTHIVTPFLMCVVYSPISLSRKNKIIKVVMYIVHVYDAIRGTYNMCTSYDSVYTPGRHTPRDTTSGCKLSQGVLHMLQHKQWYTTEYFATPGSIYCVVNVTHDIV